MQRVTSFGAAYVGGESNEYAATLHWRSTGALLRCTGARLALYWRRRDERREIGCSAALFDYFNCFRVELLKYLLSGRVISGIIYV